MKRYAASKDKNIHKLMKYARSASREAGRDLIWMETLARFNVKYRHLPSERFADEYAIRELSQYL